ncbi:MAG: hypothetical protein ACLPWO_05660 [Thermoplasmata archaeon]
MAERTETGGSLIPVRGLGARELATYGAAWLAGALPLFAVITALWLAPDTFGSTGEITIGAFAIAFPVVVRRLGVPREARFVRFLLVAGIVFGVVSILTGAGNGLTDEPYTTPRFVTLLWAHQDPYVVRLVFKYVQYGRTIDSSSIYPYLPLLMFLQVPGLDYKWFALGCWVGMVLLVRKRFDAGVLLAQPYVVVMAASGYNDLPVLLLLTVAFVGVEGRRQRWAQLLALGAKQFANAIVLVYYAVRRDWKNFLVTVGVSAAFILPFVVWSGPTVLCPAVLADRLSSCPAGGEAQFLLNYALWPVWVLAIFYLPVLGTLRASADKGRLSRILAGRWVSVRDLLRTPSFVIVGTSGALAGVSVFLGAGIYFGSSVPATIGAAVVGFLVLAGWVVAVHGAGSTGGPFLGRPLSRLPFQVSVHAVALALNVALVVGVVLLGRPALVGEVGGAFLASLWESVVFFQVQHERDPPISIATAGAAPGRGMA